MISSCGHKKPVTTPSEGIPGEVMVVANEDILDEVKGIFESRLLVKDSNLIVAEKAEKHEYENSYNCYYVREKAYEGPEKLASSIVIWNDAGEFSKDLNDVKGEVIYNENSFKLTVYRDVWAKPQLVVHCKTPDLNIEKYPDLKKFAATLSKTLTLDEVLPGNLQPNKYCDSVNKRIIGSYGFGFSFPPLFRLTFSNPEVVWLSQETNHFYRHMFINIFSDSLKIDTREKAIENRNRWTLKYLKNEEGTKTLISKSSLFPTFWDTHVAIGKQKVNILKGWYQEEGTFRRGPFLRYYFHDAANHRYVVLDGFVYAPDMPRLQFYRMFEIMARSLTLNP